MQPQTRSIVLVTVDCFRADHAGFMGYRQPTTPFLDSLAKESFVVPRAIVAGAPTYYSIPGILASRSPLALGRDVLGLVPGEPNLATILKSRNYATAAFCAGNPYISARFGYEQGFDVFRDYLDTTLEEEAAAPPAGSGLGGMNRAVRAVSHRVGLGKLYEDLYFEYCQRWGTRRPAGIESLRRFPAADSIVKDAREWLGANAGKPFFLWLHLMDPHSPYYPVPEAQQALGHNPTEPFRARYLNSFWNRSDLGAKEFARHREEVIALYDAGIRWVDEQLKVLLAHLENAGAWRNCVFAVTADHGEEFLEHGGRYHAPVKLSEELIHVPLLVRVPEAQKREVSKFPFSLLDLAPTLLEAAGVSAGATLEGCSGWARLRDGTPAQGTVISECVAGCTNPFQREHRMGPRILSVRDERFKLVLEFDPRRESLFDLQADPAETKPLPGNAEKKVRRRLLEAALEHVERGRNRRDEVGRMSAQLRDLRLECGVMPSRSIALTSQ